jgi:pimeloyl-ACP methyl ester carboxylesterase
LVQDARMGEVSCDDARIAFEDVGSGSPAIVLIHGGAFCDRRHMAPLAQHFAPSHRVVSIDLRGHGESDRVGPISNEQFADDIATLTTALGLESPVVVGHSTGGHAALELVGRHPAVAGAVVLLDIGPLSWDDSSAERNRGLAAMLRGDSGSAVLDMVAAAMMPEADSFDGRSELLERVRLASPEIFAELIESDLVWDGAGAVARCPATTPLLVIVSDHPLLDVDDFRRRCPHAMVGRTVGSGHFHQLVVPNQVTAMIDRFLEINRLSHRQGRRQT